MWGMWTEPFKYYCWHSLSKRFIYLSNHVYINASVSIDTHDGRHQQASNVVLKVTSMESLWFCKLGTELFFFGYRLKATLKIYKPCTAKSRKIPTSRHDISIGRCNEKWWSLRPYLARLLTTGYTKPFSHLEHTLHAPAGQVIIQNLSIRLGTSCIFSLVVRLTTNISTFSQPFLPSLNTILDIIIIYWTVKIIRNVFRSRFA